MVNLSNATSKARKILVINETFIFFSTRERRQQHVQMLRDKKTMQNKVNRHIHSFIHGEIYNLGV